MTHPTDHQLRHIVVSRLHKMIAAAATIPPPEDDDSDSLAYTADCHQGLIAGLERVIATNRFDAKSDDWVGGAASRIRRAAHELAGDSSLDLTTLPPAQRTLLMQGVGRALIEENRFQLQQLGDRFAPYTPHYEGFRPAAGVGAAGQPSLQLERMPT